MPISEADFNRLAAGVPGRSLHPQTSQRWRRNARFWRDVDIAMPLDRNARVRLLRQAEALEARTRAKGRQNGSVSRIGLIVLKCLMWRFLGRSGRCFPSYIAIMRETGLCKQSVRNALQRLEAVGLIRVMRRLERRHISRECSHTGVWQSFITTVQITNAYIFMSPHNGAKLLAPRSTGRSAFPKPAPHGLLRSLGIIVDGKQPSLRDRQEHTSLDLP